MSPLDDLSDLQAALDATEKDVNNSNEQLDWSPRKKHAGGANTTLYGKRFEKKTNNESRLLDMGFTWQYHHNVQAKSTQSNKHLFKKFSDGKIVTFVTQNGLKTFVKSKYHKELFRLPDEAYVIERPSEKPIIKILEKKTQCKEGSVETKLWSGPSLKREYEILFGEDFKIEYAFCVSEFLKLKLVSSEKKYTILMQILQENGINVLFGDDDDYFQTLDSWIGVV